MTTQYTTILKLALPVQGELSGTWGDVVNDNITSMVEEAVAGRKVINTWTANSHTLTSADGTTSESRAAILTLTDTGTALTGAGTVVCPALSKVYIVENSTAQVITIKTSGGTGIAVPVGRNMVVFCDGTNVEEGISNIASLSIGGDGATVTGIKDEDDMSSNSATKLATQQSIKAYVDSQVGANNELSEVLANGNTTGGTDIAVGTGDDITFADSSKAIFGAGSDLQIYHDGSHSYIDDVGGTGNLKIRATNLVLQSAIDENYATFVANGAASLFHDNAVKLATTSTGIDVTGTVTADDLTVDGVATISSTIGDSFVLNKSDGSGSPNIVFKSGGTQTAKISTDGTNAITFARGTTTALKITGGTGDISFYEDTGTTPKMVWLASDEALKFADNNKAIFGDGSDLQLYHSGSHSYIIDNGTGDLKIYGANIEIGNASGVKNLFATSGGATTLYFNNSAKLATTSTGIDVTGSVTADGLTVDGDAVINDTIPQLQLMESDTTNVNSVLKTTAGQFRIQTINDAANSTTNRFIIDHATGDLSLFEDTGTTAKLFWDASAESLGIGTSSPAEPLHVQEGSSGITSKSGTIALIEGSGNSKLSIASGTTSTGELLFGSSADNDAGRIIYDHSNDGLQVWTNGSRAVDVDSSGRVGIGTTSPATTLDVTGDITLSDTNNPTLTITDTTNTTTLFLEAANLSTTIGTSTDHPLKFDTNNTERVRIDASGNVGIGTGSPSELLTVAGNSQAATPTVLISDTDSSVAQNQVVGKFAVSVSDGSSPGAGVKTSIQTIALNAVASHYGMTFHTTNNDGNDTERMRIDSSGFVGIGTSSPNYNLTSYKAGANANYLQVANGSTGVNSANGTLFGVDASGNGVVTVQGSFDYITSVAGSERMRIDASGNLLVGKTASSFGTDGFQVNADGQIWATNASASVTAFNRRTTDGAISVFYKDGTAIGSIGTTTNSYNYFAGPNTGIFCYNAGVGPTSGDGVLSDNAKDLGAIANRWDDIYATNGTIQTSDRNEKQDIEALSDAEQRVAVAAKGLLRKFRWISSVEENGDDARIHFGIIAQDLQDAFTAEGLDAGRYAMFISSTWWETQTEVAAVEETEDTEAVDAYTRTDTYDTAEEAPEGATERTRLGVRYNELLAFIIAAI